MRQKRTYVTLLLIVALLCLGIGYALISNMSLTITGEASAAVGDGKVEVEFTGAKATTGSEDKVTAASVTEGKTTEATFTVEGLTAAGETASIDFTIQNKSSDIPATLGEPSITWTNNEWFECSYSYTSKNLAIKDEEGDTQTLTLTVKLLKTPTSQDDADKAKDTVTVSIVADPASTANN